MANPTKYTPGYSYSGFQGANPTKPLPAPRVDDDFANISRSINEAITALTDVRRSDGRLKNGIVGPDALSPTLKIGFTFRGLWAQGESYVPGDGVVHEGAFYSALVRNVATEQNAPGDDAYWTELFSVDDLVVSGALSMPVNRFTGDGARVEFDLDFTPVTAKNLLITIGGAPQETTQYLTNGNKLTFNEPPPEGYSIEVRGFATLAVSDTIVSDTILEGDVNLFQTVEGRAKLAALPNNAALNNLLDQKQPVDASLTELAGATIGAKGLELLGSATTAAVINALGGSAGKIVSAMIASLDAAKLTGTIDLARLPLTDLLEPSDIGVSVQAYSGNLATLAGVTPLAAGTSILAMAQASDVRNFLDTAPYVATRTALKAVDTTKETTCLLAEPGREGIFNWKAGNYSAQIAADTSEGIYVKATAIAVSAGAWVRVFDGGVDPMWFGAGGDGVAIDTGPFKSAAIVAMAMNLPLWLGARTWRVKDGQWPGYSGDEKRTVVLIDGVRLVVRGEGATILFDGANVTEYATIFRTINGGTIDREGVTLDYKNLPFTQGVCLSKTGNSARFLLDTAACGTPTWADIERLCQYNFEPAIGKYVFGSTIFEANGTHRAITLVSGSTYDVSFTADVAALAAVTVGQTYVMYHKVNGYYFSDVTDGSLYSRKCWVRAVAGMGDSGSYVKDFVIDGGGVAPPFGSRRIIATNSDGIAHVNGCSGRFDVRPDRVEGTSDDSANLNCPFNNVSAAPGGAVFTMAVVLPGRLPVVGDRLWGIRPDGSQVDLQYVASIAGNVITMSVALPAGFNTTWKIGNDTWITKGAIYAPKIVSRIAGGGAVIRGFDYIVRGDYSDVNGPAFSPVCFWPTYNEGPISKNFDVQISVLRCGRNRDNVPGVVRIDALRIDTGMPAPAGVIVGGRVQIKAKDCRPAVLYSTSCDSVSFHIDEFNTGYDQWSAVPQPTAVTYLQNHNNCSLEHIHTGATDVVVYLQDCARINTAGSKNVTFTGSGILATHQSMTVSGGGNTVGAGGRVRSKVNAGAQDDLPMTEWGGYLEDLKTGEHQGGFAVWSRPVGSVGQALQLRLRVTAAGWVMTPGHAWDGNHLVMGSYHLWGDGAGRLRTKNSAPSSISDGAAITLSSDFTGSPGVNGWEKLPDGRVRQWGIIPNSGAADIVITFPVAFGTFYGATTTPNQYSGVDAFVSSYDSANTTTMAIRRRKISVTGAVSETAFQCQWEAWGI